MLCYNCGMFGLTKPKLPITEEQQKWVDNSFLRLASLLGKKRLFKATVVLPTPEYFPDLFDGSEQALQRMFHRVATQMGLDPDDIEVTLFVTGHDLTKGLVPFFSGEATGAAGLYHHDPMAKPHISVDEAQMKDPMSLVAVLAHELGHIILLRPGLISRDDPDMEPLNDLLAVFLGFGIFTANSVFRFEQHDTDRSHGWSARRQGYLSEELFGYALARFAHERGEVKPVWSNYLSTNIKGYRKRSSAWLINRNEPRLFPCG
jgi:hypothetical protein